MLRIFPDIILLSFRLGLAAHIRALRLEPIKGSWAVAVSGLSFEDGESLLDEYYSGKVASNAWFCLVNTNLLLGLSAT